MNYSIETAVSEIDSYFVIYVVPSNDNDVVDIKNGSALNQIAGRIDSDIVAFANNVDSAGASVD